MPSSLQKLDLEGNHVITLQNGVLGEATTLKDFTLKGSMLVINSYLKIKIKHYMIDQDRLL